jgi:hypothetical protein
MSHAFAAFLSFVDHLQSIAQHVAHQSLLHVMVGSGALSG